MTIAEKLQTIAENEQKVYDKGFDNGRSRGYDEGLAEGQPLGYQQGYNEGYDYGKMDGKDEGKLAERDAFWEAYQESGNRTLYMYAFAGLGWVDSAYNPKYPIAPTNAFCMFHTSRIENVKIDIDFSQCTTMGDLFRASTIKAIGTVDCRKATNSDGIFTSAWKLESIDNWIVSEENSMYSHFTETIKLQHLTVTGTIGKTGLLLSSCTLLSKASITSVFNALSTTTSGLSVTFSKTAVNNAFTTEEWETLVATKSNWTISLQ